MNDNKETKNKDNVVTLYKHVKFSKESVIALARECGIPVEMLTEENFPEFVKMFNEFIKYDN